MAADASRALLENALSNGRIHSAYLMTGAGSAPSVAARAFARGLVCTAPPGRERPCETCAACTKSAERMETGDDGQGAAAEQPQIDGKGKKGPLYLHVGEHPDLYYVARGDDDTRVRVGQVRAVQSALRFAANEGGHRAVIIDDAEWLNAEAQNALLKLLEEPPDRTTLILLAPSPSTLLPTIRSRCVRIALPAEERIVLRGDGAREEHAPIVERLDGIHRLDMPALLDWAEEFRGPRASAAEKVTELLDVSSEWVRDRVGRIAAEGDAPMLPLIDAYKTLLRCRREVALRNANPQMIAERGLIAVREAFSLS